MTSERRADFDGTARYRSSLRWPAVRERAAAAAGCVGSGLAIALLVGGAAGVIVGLGTVLVLGWAVRRWEPPAHRRELRRAGTDLPVAADLLAAALRAGAPTEQATRVVGAALGGPMGRRLVACAEELSAGSAPAVAWRNLDDVLGAHRLVRSAVRSADSGAAFSGALAGAADDLRLDRSARAEAKARQVGVLVVLPLGLCFLPAFVLTGVVPVVVAVLGDVLAAR